MASSLPPDIIPTALAPAAFCPKLQNGKNWQQLKFISLQKRNDLLFGSFPCISLFGQLCLERPGQPECKKAGLSGSPNCLPSYWYCQLMPRATLLKSQPETDMKGDKTHKGSSSLVNCCMAFKEGKSKQLEIQP